jgi:dihydroflavonol-4-reductase
MTQALVLGGTGFIGGQIARAALAAGYSVRVLRRRHTVGALADIARRIEWVHGDLDDEATLVSAAADCDVLFHAAAYYPHNSDNIAADVAYAEAQMGRVLRAARQAGVGRVIYTSSLTTLGPPSEPGRLADERDFYTPGSSGSAYYEAKFSMERLARQAAADGLPVVILLPTAVFGPGDIKPTTGEIVLVVARGFLPVYFPAAINIVDGRDVALAHIAAVQKGRVGERYIIGGHNVTLRDALVAVAEAAGVAPPRIRLPRALIDALVRTAAMVPGVEVPDNVRMLRFWQPLSTLKAERELGLEARPYEQTVHDTLAWFQAHGYLE